MLSIPTSGFARSVNAHNVKLDAFCDWIARIVQYDFVPKIFSWWWLLCTVCLICIIDMENIFFDPFKHGQIQNTCHGELIATVLL